MSRGRAFQANGIIAITKTDSARDRFCITLGERAIISEARIVFCPEHLKMKLMQVTC